MVFRLVLASFKDSSIQVVPVRSVSVNVSHSVLRWPEINTVAQKLLPIHNMKKKKNHEKKNKQKNMNDPNQFSLTCVSGYRVASLA